MNTTENKPKNQELWQLPPTPSFLVSYVAIAREKAATETEE